METKIFDHYLDLEKKWGFQPNVLFNDYSKTIWYKPSRTAGTSLAETIYRFSNDYISPKNYYFAPINELADKVSDFDFIKNYFKFIIVRNPYDRTLSMYRWVKKNPKHFKSINCDKLTFEDFIQNKIIDKETGLFSNPHYLPQTSCLILSDTEKLPATEYIDAVFRFENLELSFNYIIAYIFGRTMNWHNEIYKKIIKINDTFDKTDLRNYYNRRTKKIVEDLYEYDFNLYELGESK